MDYVSAFIVGGLICVIAQILMDRTKLTPARILVIFVTLGAILGGFGIYDKLIEIGGAGATIPLPSFGNSLADAAIKGVKEDGLLGAKQFTGENLPCKDLIVLDYLGKPGAVAYKAPAMEKIKCTFKGKKAHAGIEPEKGINAILVASDAISNMHIGRIDELTTSNIGRI